LRNIIGAGMIFNNFFCFIAQPFSRVVSFGIAVNSLPASFSSQVPHPPGTAILPPSPEEFLQ